MNQDESLYSSYNPTPIQFQLDQFAFLLALHYASCCAFIYLSLNNNDLENYLTRMS